MAQTDVKDFIDDLDAGIFEQKFAHMLSEVALAAVIHNKTGKVSIEFTIQQIAEGSQVMITHKLKNSKPTKRGMTTEEDKTQTAMFVAKGGAMSALPPAENALKQLDVFANNNMKEN